MEGVSLDQNSRRRAAGVEPGAKPISREEAERREEIDFSKEFEILSKTRRRLARPAGAGRRRAALHLRGGRKAPAFLRFARERDLAAGTPHAAGRTRGLPAPGAWRRCATSSAASTTAVFLTPTPADIALHVRPRPGGRPGRAEAARRPLIRPASAPRTSRSASSPSSRPRAAATSLAARIIRDHFELLTRRRIPDLARRLGASLDEMQAAIEEIGTLDPAPGPPLRRRQQPRGRPRCHRGKGRRQVGDPPQQRLHSAPPDLQDLPGAHRQGPLSKDGTGLPARADALREASSSTPSSSASRRSSASPAKFSRCRGSSSSTASPN